MVGTVSGECTVLVAESPVSWPIPQVPNSWCSKYFRSLWISGLPLCFPPQRFAERRCLRMGCGAILLATSFCRDVGWTLRIYISNVFPGYLDSTSVGTICQESLLGDLCIQWVFLVGSLVSLTCLQIFYLKAQDITHFHSFCSSKHVYWDLC